MMLGFAAILLPRLALLCHHHQLTITFPFFTIIYLDRRLS
jgi:hypothetical protein